jgi:hypothetical protein
VTIHLECRGCRVSEMSARVHKHGEIGAFPRDASIPAELGSLRHPRTVISSSRVHHDGRDAWTSRFVCIKHVAHAGHNDHDYPQQSSLGLQQLQWSLKARERVSNSLNGSGATSSGCARAHPPGRSGIESKPSFPE